MEHVCTWVIAVSRNICERRAQRPASHLRLFFLHLLPSNGATYTNFENLIDKKHHVD